MRQVENNNINIIVNGLIAYSCFQELNKMMYAVMYLILQ